MEPDFSAKVTRRGAIAIGLSLATLPFLSSEALGTTASKPSAASADLETVINGPVFNKIFEGDPRERAEFADALRAMALLEPSFKVTPYALDGSLKLELKCADLVTDLISKGEKGIREARSSSGEGKPVTLRTKMGSIAQEQGFGFSRLTFVAHEIDNNRGIPNDFPGKLEFARYFCDQLGSNFVYPNPW